MEVDGKLSIDVHGRIWYIYIEREREMLYVHHMESTLMILQTRLKKGNGSLGKSP